MTTDELAMKGMLRWVGIDPPRWHDVGAVMQSQRERLPVAVIPSLEAIVGASARLRKEREMAFYGEVDFVPGKHYDREQALAAIAAADAVLGVLHHFP